MEYTYTLVVANDFYAPALAEHTVFVVSVRNGSQLTGVLWELRLAGHTSATHTFLVFFSVICILYNSSGRVSV